MVGVTGIEPATSCTPSKHATTALHPDEIDKDKINKDHRLLKGVGY